MMNMRIACSMATLCCIALLGDTRADEVLAKVTFTEQIAPLVFKHCASCHRPGEAAPFSLLTYQSTRSHAKTMLEAMEARYMPPWQPEPGHGEFRDARRLTDSQIALFKQWVKDGMPEGDPSKMPPVPKFPEGWQIGKPDLIVKMDRPFEVPASGPDIYQNFVIPLGLKEDKWVTAVEFRATAPNVVHHVLYFLDDSGRARKQNSSKEGQPGFPGMGFRATGSLGGWAVGATPVKLPDGLAYPLPKGSDLVLQTHFHLSGKSEKEMITVGIYFADKPPTRTLVNLQLPPVFGLFSNIDIAAGQSNFKIADKFILPVDVDLVGAGAHAHYIAKTMKADATLPDKTTKPLFFIRDWNFNWQGQYLYKDYVRLPKGTVIQANLTWDNSSNNPRNPSDPPIRVHWGEESTDEMGSIRFFMVAAHEAETKKLQDAIRGHVRQAAVVSQLRRDKIDWGKLGVDPSQIGRPNSPGKTIPPKQDKEKSKTGLLDLNGNEHHPLTVTDAKAHVLVFVTQDCPIANGYSPEINSLVKDFTDKPVRFFLVQVDPELSKSDAKKHAEEYGLKLPVILDTKHQLVAAVGATRTPEAAILLPGGTVAYLGRIDDLYPGLGKKRQKASRHDLRNALAQVVAGEPVTVARTEAIGCAIGNLPTR